MNKKVLFIGHDASRTGAPLLLLEVVRWLKYNSEISPHFLLLKGGDLEEEYKSLGPVDFISTGKTLPKYNQILKKIGLLKENKITLAERYPEDEFPIIYANTIATLGCIRDLACENRKIIHHIHELSYITESFTTVDNFKEISLKTNLYIAASRSVKQYLIDTINICQEKVMVIHEFPISTAIGKVSSRDLVRVELGIPKEAFVIGMCGWPQWRKGPDLFVQIANIVINKKRRDNAYFIWLGGSKETHVAYEYDLAKLNIESKCFFIEHMQDPEKFYDCLDLYALTSREDPFSVAMLEAGLRSVPIVCFKDSGGATELVQDEGGISVPYVDVEAMSEAVCFYNDNETIKSNHGNKLKNLIQQEYSLESKCHEIGQLIKNI